MTRSETIGALAAALAKAQSQIAGAAKDKTNPHFKSSYADLASVWDACRTALTANGLAVLQPVSAEGSAVTVTTLLTHSSGEWISTDLTMTAGQNTPQGIGSCITYARRYGLSAMVGVAPEDDDGNAASQASTSGPARVAAPRAPEGYADWLVDMQAAADEGRDALAGAWKASFPALRDYLTKSDGAAYEALKARAAKVKVTA